MGLLNSNCPEYDKVFWDAKSSCEACSGDFVRVAYWATLKNTHIEKSGILLPGSFRIRGREASTLVLLQPVVLTIYKASSKSYEVLAS